MSVISSFCCSYQTPHPPHLLFSVSSSFFFLSSFICLPRVLGSCPKCHPQHDLFSVWAPPFSLPLGLVLPSCLKEHFKKRKKKERKGDPLFFFFFCKCCFKPSLYLLCLWLMWALVCIFNHFSCLILDCPHLLFLSFYSTSSLLYVSLSSSGLRCIIIKLTTDSFLRTRSHFIYVCSELLSCFLLQG